MNQVYNKSAFVLQPWLVRQVWNSLGNDLRDPDLNIASIGRLLKTHLFQHYSVNISALEALCDNALYKY